MTDVSTQKVANPRETIAASPTLGLATFDAALPPRPASGPWRDPARGHGKGKNPVLMISMKPEPVFDSEGRPRRTGKNERNRMAEKQHLPSHGAPFLTLHGTAVELLKLLLGAGEHEAARLLLCDIEQLTYVGEEQRATASGAQKDDDGNWHLTFDNWRVIDEDHVVMTLPRGVVEIEDPSASQAAWRSLPERDKFISALVNAAEISGCVVDVDFLWSLHDRAQEISEHDYTRARDLLIRCGIERWNEFGKLEINAPLLIQGPAGVRKLFEATLDPDAERAFVPIDNGDPGTQCGRRSKLTQTQRQEGDIRWLTEELSETCCDRDAVLERATEIVAERDRLRDDLSALFDEMQAFIDRGRRMLDDPTKTDAQVRAEMRRAFEAERDDHGTNQERKEA